MFQRAFLIALLALCSTAMAFKQTSLDLKSRSAGVQIYKDYVGQPDKQGVFEQISLNLPAFKQAEYYRGTWWPYGGNRVFGELLSKKSQEGGIFSILQLESGEYLAVLPLCGDQAYAWFAPQNGKLALRFGHKGTKTIKGDMPVVAWARGRTPYEASHKVWKMATQVPQIKGNMKLREAKKYPEMFNYLGWCSWEQFYRKISDKLLVDSWKALEKSEVPIRYMIVDDGHFDTRTLKPNGKFPNGYKTLAGLRNEKGIKWLGMWHGVLGDAQAVPKNSPPDIKNHMMNVHAGRAIPKANPESIRAFMEYLTAYSKRDDVDFLKVDFCGTVLPFAAGSKNGLPAYFPKDNRNSIPNPTEYTVMYSRIYQEHVGKDFNGLLNCNWHIPHFIFNSGDNNVGRCGPDYKMNVSRARECVYHSFSAMPWLGQIAWGDHDMFHSTDKLAARMMAISKAVSGGPVYLSDHPDHVIPKVVWPLCYQDGRLLGTLAPGAPVSDDVFFNMNDQRIFRTFAPLANKSVAIACYNLQGNGKNASPKLETSITPRFYQEASSMIQPYTGLWSMPKDGLLVYDHQTQTAQKLTKSGLAVSISGFGEKLYQLSPIVNGWSVVGRTDKHLSAAAVKVGKVTNTSLSLRLLEQGPFAIWLASGKPVAQGVTFEAKGNGLFVANLPIKAQPLTLKIMKK